MPVSVFRSGNLVSFSAAQFPQKGWSMLEPTDRGNLHIFTYYFSSNHLRSIGGWTRTGKQGSGFKEIVQK